VTVRPKVTEQLEGMRRILADVVAPEIVHPYPADILGGVIAALESLERSWYEVPRFLRWDAQATGEFLLAARGALDEATADEITRATASGPDDPLDLERLEAHDERLRALLARVAPTIASQPDLSELNERMMSLFRERAQRFPFGLLARPAPPVPSS
jgi:hypothetical protein